MASSISLARELTATFVAFSIAVAAAAMGIKHWNHMSNSGPTCLEVKQRLNGFSILPFTAALAKSESGLAELQGDASLSPDDRQEVMSAAISLLSTYFDGSDAELLSWLDKHSMEPVTNGAIEDNPTCKGLLDRIGGLPHEIDADHTAVCIIREALLSKDKGAGSIEIVGIVDSLPFALVLTAWMPYEEITWLPIPVVSTRHWLATSASGGKTRLTAPKQTELWHGNVQLVQVAFNVAFRDGLRCPMHFLFARKEPGCPWVLLRNYISNDCDYDHFPLTL